MPLVAATTFSVFTSVTLGGSPFGEAYDASTHELYVTNGNGNNVTVLSDPSLQVVATIGVGTGPDGIAYDPGRGELFVANSGDGNVSVISDASHSVAATIMVGGAPWAVAYDPTLAEVFVSTFTGNDVVVIADSNNTVVYTVSLGSLVTPRAGPAGLAFDAGTDELYVAAWTSGYVIAFAVNQSYIRFAAESMVDTQPDEVAYVPSSNEIFVTSHANPGMVDVISDSMHSVVARVAVGANPIGLAYDPTTDEVMVANAGASNVSIIAVTNHTVVQSVNLLFMGASSGVAYDGRTGAVFVSDSLLGAVTVLLASDPVPYAVSGLPSPTSWTIAFSGTASAGYSIANDLYSSITYAGEFFFPSGSYTFSVGTVAGFRASPVQGSFSVPSTTPLTIVFSREYSVRFLETGLAASANWSVNLSGTLQYSTTTSIQFTVINGTYAFVVAGPVGFQPNMTSGSLTVAGANVTRQIGFAAVYTVTFTEFGLAAGTTWSITLASQTLTSLATTITFMEPTGSYPFTVGHVSGYNATPSSGTVYVTGADAGQRVNFTVPSTSTPGPGSGLLGLPGNDGVLIIIAIVAIIAVVGGLLAVRRRGGRPPTGADAPEVRSPPPSGPVPPGPSSPGGPSG
jgi:YVTN family beta-propeller protein